jgi:hypothetical protein
MAMRGTAFGLDVDSEIPLPFLEWSRAKPTGRTLGISAESEDETTSRWPKSAEFVCDERQPDGNVVFQIESHPRAGYLISGPRYGSHLLSVDGRWLRCGVKGRHEQAWQRLLIAQVLPFAAVLNGLEVFHASAVVRNGAAVAFLGPSRAGKTSLALELCRQGAGFLADDVLALEPHAEELLAHPGTPLAGVDNGEEGRPSHRDPREAVLAVDARERLVHMPGTAQPTRLEALFFVDRRADGPAQPRFEPAANAQILLSATFNFVLASPRRLQNLLDVCALAARLRVDRIVAGPSTSASELAVAVERRLSTPV